MKQETKDLLIAWLILSLAFAIVLRENTTLAEITRMFVIAGFSVGIAFIVHELSHRRLARKYGCWAEFRANYRMLFLALLMSFLGFVFAAPGAVHIHGHVTKAQRGKISLSGPLSNIILAGILLPLYFLFPSGITGRIFFYGAWINAFLAVFNLLPIPGLDGSKVLYWSKKIYALVFIAAILLMVLVWILPL